MQIWLGIIRHPALREVVVVRGSLPVGEAVPERVWLWVLRYLTQAFQVEAGQWAEVWVRSLASVIILHNK